eukprot:scaffold6079_cov88-Skeletonema_marinoi.AAC.1
MAEKETSCTRKSCCGSACAPRPPIVYEVPLIDLQDSTLIPRSAFQDAYDSHQALHIRGYKPSKQANDDAEFFHADDVKDLFHSLGEQDEASWCIENEKNHKPNDDDDDDTEAKPGNFLHNNNKGRGYCSFLVQHSQEVLEDLLTSRLPMVHLPVKESDSKDDATATTMRVNYGPALWLFFGKNYNSNESLLGRPEHTDSVTHDGTFHYQLSGTKIWRLRPTAELMEQNESSPSNKKRKVEESESDKANDNHIEVECRQGDILLLNTRLWWHSTNIPSQDDPCISYARDIYFSEQKHDCENEPQSNRESSMTNVDGTWATEAIEADTILFTEHNMPDIELPRVQLRTEMASFLDNTASEGPNCQLVELEDDEGGTFMAVVTLRDIREGEFFTLLESDDEEESGDEDCSEEALEEEE